MESQKYKEGVQNLFLCKLFVCLFVFIITGKVFINIAPLKQFLKFH